MLLRHFDFIYLTSVSLLQLLHLNQYDYQYLKLFYHHLNFHIYQILKKINM